MSPNDGANNGGDRTTEAGKLDDLLIKEMDEAHNWARLGAQIYFGWFTLLLTVNGVATGWLFTRTGAMPWFTRIVFCVFIGLNLMGTIATYRIRRHLGESDGRIQKVLESLIQHRASEDDLFRPLSPVPRAAIKTAFGFTGLALIMLIVFWAILTLLPSRFFLG